MHRGTDRHLPARFTANQRQSQPLAARSPNQPVVLSYPAHEGRELNRSKGYHHDNRVCLDGEDVSLKRGRLDPGMFEQAPEKLELTIIDEFKMIKHKREKFFVPGKVRSRCPRFEPF